MRLFVSGSGSGPGSVSVSESLCLGLGLYLCLCRCAGKGSLRPRPKACVLVNATIQRKGVLPRISSAPDENPLVMRKGSPAPRKKAKSGPGAEGDQRGVFLPSIEWVAPCALLPGSQVRVLGAGSSGRACSSL